MNHFLKNPDAHRRLARGANASSKNIKLRKELLYQIQCIRINEFGEFSATMPENFAKWVIHELGGMAGTW